MQRRRVEKQRNENVWRRESLQTDFLFGFFVPFSVMKCNNGGKGWITASTYSAAQKYENKINIFLLPFVVSKWFSVSKF